MTDNELKEEGRLIAVQSSVGKKDGTVFRSFLSQPVIREALARYVYAEARGLLWFASSERYGQADQRGDKIGPKWLDDATDGDELEEHGACYALEVAIQEEVEKRVAAALAEARTQAQKTTVPRLRELTRHLASVVRRSAAEQQASNLADTEKAMEAAGLRSRSQRKKPAEKI